MHGSPTGGGSPLAGRPGAGRGRALAALKKSARAMRSRFRSSRLTQGDAAHPGAPHRLADRQVPAALAEDECALNLVELRADEIRSCASGTTQGTSIPIRGSDSRRQVARYTGDAQARTFARRRIVSALRAALRRWARAGFSRNALARRKTPARRRRSRSPVGEISVLDRVLAGERDLRAAPVAAGRTSPITASARPHDADTTFRWRRR